MNKTEAIHQLRAELNKFESALFEEDKEGVREVFDLLPFYLANFLFSTQLEKPMDQATKDKIYELISVLDNYYRGYYEY